MEDIGSLWRFEEGIDEVKQKLEYMTYQVEKKNAEMKKLFQILQTALKERDEAVSEFKKLKQSLSTELQLPISPDTPLIYPNYPTKSNSSAVSSPDSAVADHDDHQAALIIRNLAKGRPLPSKGSLLKAVKDAGPLLHTLLVAGSLPRWRNPPALLPHPVPPIRNCNSYTLGPSSVPNFDSQIPKRQRFL